jgi:hypothetical protein
MLLRVQLPHGCERIPAAKRIIGKTVGVVDAEAQELALRLRSLKQRVLLKELTIHASPGSAE